MTLSKDTAITIIVLGYVGLAKMSDCGNSGEQVFHRYPALHVG